MKEQSSAAAAINRAGRRVVYHLLQAAVEGLKAVEAVIEEIGVLATRQTKMVTDRPGRESRSSDPRH